MTRLYYAADIHGSEKCFRKFVNAGRFYEVDVLILGGDLTGRTLVPVVESAGRWEARIQGRTLVARDGAELEELERRIRFAGGYPYLVEKGGDAQAIPAHVQQACRAEAVAAVREWVRLADERLAGTGIRCFIMPGNDDPPEIADVLWGSRVVVNPEDQVVALDAEYEMISVGYSNPTPWNSYRECSEAELAERIERQASGVRRMDRCVFNLHCPPADTALDQAARLNPGGAPILLGGNPVTGPAGSWAVRKAIERHQPILSLHGHIHESKGKERLGRTLAFNPGSDYQNGFLNGIVINLDKRGIQSFIFTFG